MLLCPWIKHTLCLCVPPVLSVLQAFQTDTCVPYLDRGYFPPSVSNALAWVNLSRKYPLSYPNHFSLRSSGGWGLITKCSKECCWGASGTGKDIIIIGDWHLFPVRPVPDLGQALHVAYSVAYSSQQHCEAGTIVMPTSKMRKLGHRAFKFLQRFSQ